MKTKRLDIAIDGITMSISPATVEKVMGDFERENPGRLATGMTSAEFADRMMKQLKASAFQTPKGEA